MLGLERLEALPELLTELDRIWRAVAWVVVLWSFGGYGAYMVVLRRRGALRVSTLLSLTPPVTAAWAFLMFGEVPGPPAWPGAAACAVGVVLVLRSGRHETVGVAAHDGSHDGARRLLPRHRSVVPGVVPRADPRPGGRLARDQLRAPRARRRAHGVR